MIGAEHQTSKASRPRQMTIRWGFVRNALPFIVLLVHIAIWWGAIQTKWITCSNIERAHEAHVQARIGELAGAGVDVTQFEGRRRYIRSDGLPIYLDPPVPFEWEVMKEELRAADFRLKCSFLICETLAIVVVWPRLPVAALGLLIRFAGRSCREIQRLWRGAYDWVHVHWRG
jgi:hypothetical protein